MDRKSFKAGEIIFKEGEKTATMYRIEKGEVRVVINFGKKNETEISVLKPGKFFGEMGIVDNAKRSATIIALNDVELLEIDKTSFPNFISNNPEDAIKIMKNLSANLRSRTNDYMDACKTISELMKNDDDKPKKEGIWATLKKYADVYADLHLAYEEDPTFLPYIFGTHYTL